MQDEAFVLEAAHGELEGGKPVAAGDVREPATIFFRRVFAHATDVRVHRKTQSIRVDTAVVRAVEARLEHHAGVRLQELHHEAFGHQAFIVEVVHQGVMPERRPAFIHDLGLSLRVEVLGNLTHDTHHFALPGLEQRRVFSMK